MFQNGQYSPLNTPNTIWNLRTCFIWPLNLLQYAAAVWLCCCDTPSHQIPASEMMRCAALLHMGEHQLGASPSMSGGSISVLDLAIDDMLKSGVSMSQPLPLLQTLASDHVQRDVMGLPGSAHVYQLLNPHLMLR